MVQLADRVAALFEGEVQVIEVPMPPEYPQDQTQRRCPDIIKARTHLHYDPKVDIDTGLALMLQWSRKVIADTRQLEPIAPGSVTRLKQVSI